MVSLEGLGVLWVVAISDHSPGSFSGHPALEEMQAPRYLDLAMHRFGNGFTQSIDRLAMII